jgi:LysM repeat protein
MTDLKRGIVRRAGEGPGPTRSAPSAYQEGGSSVSSNRPRNLIAIVVTACAVAASPADAALPHTVQPGETLWSIAAANNLTTRTVAAYNGLSEDSPVYTGETITVPTTSEGAAALADAGATEPSTASPVATSAAAATPTTVTATPPAPSAPSWTAPIYCPTCPSGQAYLAANAAANWNAMRQESLRLYGIDLYPAGPLSAYRSYTQQLYLYDLYISGQGSLAAVPGSSSHEYGAALDLADPSMRSVIDQIGATYGWAKTEAPQEWWHVSYVGP